MGFWKEHTILRMVLIAVLFVVGLAAVYSGWRMTGNLGIMVAGTGFLVAALWIYNKPFERTHRKK